MTYVPSITMNLKIITGVYSGELELKNKNEDPCKVSLLDISTEVYDKKVTTELFE